MSDKEHKEPAHLKQPEESRESLEKAAMQDDQMQEIHDQLLREKDEPHEAFKPIPVFLLFIFGALSFWAGIYFVKYSGDYRWDAYDPNFRAGVEQAPPPEISLIERGAKVYRAQCAQCHQASGLGVAGVYPPLADSDWVTGHTEVLARILINGLNGPIVVKGNTYNGNMPAFGPNGLNLRPVEIAGVMTYIRQEWGNAAPEVTEEMIDGYLASYASRAAPWQAPAVKEDLGPDPAGGEGAAPAPEPAPAEEIAEAAPEATAAAAKPSGVNEV